MRKFLRHSCDRSCDLKSISRIEMKYPGVAQDLISSSSLSLLDFHQEYLLVYLLVCFLSLTALVMFHSLAPLKT